MPESHVADFTNIVNQLISSSLWLLTLKIVIIYTIINFIKIIGNTLIGFISIKLDIFGVGSTVEYNGKRGIIREIGFRKIKLLMLDTREMMYIRTQEWEKLNLIIQGKLSFDKDSN